MVEARMQPQQPEGQVSDLTGTTVGRFVIGPRLGKGGMGEVYQAEDTGLRRSVALKRIPPTMRNDQRYRQRLWKEAESASRLNDPHIAAVYDVLEDRDELFLVMEYVDGQTLRRRLAHPLAVSEFLEIAVQCSSALAAAHQRGVLHCDIKPENIMLTPSGQAKVLDFGLARNLQRGDGAATRDTRAGSAFVGTLPYMAPEVLEEKEPDARADIFSLGVVSYEALAGHNPFRAEGFLATCERILHEDPAPVSALNSLVPHELDRIVSKMLAKNPAQRYSSAADLTVDLDALRRTVGVLGPQKRLPRAHATSRLTLASAIFAATILLVVAATLAYRHFRSPLLPEHATILVADFENRTGEKIFDQTVVEALRQALQQSRYVRVVPRTQVLEAAQRAGRIGVTHVDAALGGEICQRDNYRALLTGVVASQGSGYLITAQILDPVERAPVLTETVTLTSPIRLYPAVDDLAKRLRQHLGESLAQVVQSSTPLARVTTPSLEALQRYSLALDRYSAGDFDGFMPLAKSAIELDPEFAMAHLYLALAYDRVGNEKEARQHMLLACKGLDRVTERERYLILATDYEQRGLYEQAAEKYRLLTELNPDDLEAYQGMAPASDDSGRPADAVVAEKRALQLSPYSAIDRLRLILYLDRLNHFPEAAAEYESANALGVKSPQLHWGAGLAYLGQDDSASARREFDLLEKEGGPYEASLAALCVARVLMYEGRLREAADSLRAGLILDETRHSETWIPVRRYLLVEVERIRGRMEVARTEARQLAVAAQSSPNAEEIRRAGLVELEVGEPRTARRLLARLADLRTHQDSRFAQSCYENLKGSVQLAAGNPHEAAENQERASVFSSSFEAYDALGKAYEAEKNWSKAILAYQKYLQLKGGILVDDFPAGWVLAHLSLARASARMGDTQQSLQFYDEFLRLWAGADSDLPDLRQARAEREKLHKGFRPDFHGLEETP
jgi:eukaryotic-like serine/threonine-protein kinase